MNNDNMKNEMNRQLISTAFKSKLKVHLVLKNNSWRNGYVEELTSSDYFLFKDMKNPIEPFFYLELLDVKPFIFKEEK